MPAVGIIGCGNLGCAIIQRWLDDGMDPDLIRVVDHHPDKVESLGVKSVSIDDLSGIEALILAIKPNDIPELLGKLEIDPGTIVVSMAAGLGINKLSELLPPEQPICRAMLSIGVRVGAGFIALSFNKYANTICQENVQGILSPLGQTMVLKESNLDTVTALVGSGPAFASVILEACVMGGIAGGLSKDISKELILETFQATIDLIKSGINFDDLRFQVSSPAGATIEGLEVLESNNIRGALIRSIKAASRRSSELGT